MMRWMQEIFGEVCPILIVVQHRHGVPRLDGGFVQAVPAEAGGVGVDVLRLVVERHDGAAQAVAPLHLAPGGS